MREQEIYAKVKVALDKARQDKEFVKEMHLQMIKYADDLAEIAHPEKYNPKQFPKGVGIEESYAKEFNKMRRLTQRLKRAGLDVSKI